MAKDVNAFYAEKGLKRVTVTIKEETSTYLVGLAKTLGAKADKVANTGDVIEAVRELCENSEVFAMMLNERVLENLAQKEVKKAGRKITTLEGKLRHLSDEERAKIEAMIDGK